ncbi:FxsA family protein [Paenibacillus lutrae]|uniref:Exclusion suppressor FxsA n=1 Tax=Paenibacillus lutrae TaxID=2078573 RepID=A0A7X3FJK5_9BACL|nr:FxsA family protein [Paenibacillus lutrae]MVP00913.1 exclusion suppressor FxsA [Paenibacillus lutrae]
MLRKVLAVILLVPVLEIALLIGMVSLAGGWFTFTWILVTALIGALLVKREARRISSYRKSQVTVIQNPADSIIDSLSFFIGGLLLIIPGFLTDLVGVLLILPFTRPLFKVGMVYLLQKLMRGGNFTFINRR